MIAILTAKENMPYTKANPIIPAQDRELSEGETRSADEAQVKASPPHEATCPRAGVLAQLAIDRPVCNACSAQLQRFFNQVGLKPTFVGESLEPTAAQKASVKISGDKLRGLTETAVAAAMGLTRTHAEAEFRAGIIYVTLIEPRPGQHVRQELIERYLARCAKLWNDPRQRDEHDYIDACIQLRKSMRLTRDELNLLGRIEQLAGDLAKGDESWALRRKIGKIVMEVKSR